jgi:hypothetical protein
MSLRMRRHDETPEVTCLGVCAISSGTGFPRLQSARRSGNDYDFPCSGSFASDTELIRIDSGTHTSPVLIVAVPRA